MNTHIRRRFSPGRPAWLLMVGLPLAVLAVAWFIASFEGISYALVPGMLAAIAIALIGTRYERLPFYLLLASFPILAHLRLNDSISLLLLIVPGGLVMLAWLQHIFLRRATIIFDRSTALAVLFGFWIILSAMNASGSTAELSGYVYRYWQGIILLFLTQNLLREKQHFVELGWVLAISLGLYCTFIILNQASVYLQSGGSLGARQLHSSLRSIANPNVAGMWINTAIPFAFLLMSLAQIKKSRGRFSLLALSVILMVLGVLSTVSVGAGFGLGVTLALLILWSKNRNQRVGLILLGLIVIGAALVSPLAERMNDELRVVAEEDPMEWGTRRGLAWYIAVQAIRQSPWLGHGPGLAGVQEVSAIYMPLDLLSLGRTPLSPHNIFLALGAELGIPGLLAFLAILASVIPPLWRAIRRQQARSGDSEAAYMGQAILIALIVLLAHGMVRAGHLNRYLWILLGAASAFTRMSTGDSLARSLANTHSRARARMSKVHLA